MRSYDSYTGVSNENVRLKLIILRGREELKCALAHFKPPIITGILHFE